MASTSPDSSAAGAAGEAAPGEAVPGGGAVASAAARPATYFDGVTNRRHVVVLRFGPALDLVEDGVALAAWPYADLRAVDGGPGMLRLKCVSALPLARLEVPDPAAQVEIGMHARSLQVERGGRGKPAASSPGRSPPSPRSC